MGGTAIAVVAVLGLLALAAVVAYVLLHRPWRGAEIDQAALVEREDLNGLGATPR